MWVLELVLPASGLSLPLWSWSGPSSPLGLSQDRWERDRGSVQAVGDHWGAVGAHTDPEGPELGHKGERREIGRTGGGVCLGSSPTLQVAMGKFSLREWDRGLCPSPGLLGGGLAPAPTVGM